MKGKGTFCKFAAAAVILGCIGTGTLCSQASASELSMQRPTEVMSVPDMIDAIDEKIMADNDGALIVYMDFEEAKIEYDPAGEDGPTGEQFIRDMKSSYYARSSVVQRYSGYDQMPEELYNYYRFACVEAERPFYEAYSDASFSNMNYQSMCDAYMDGLASQFEAEDLWMAGEKTDAVESSFFTGYTERIEVLVQASEFYGGNLNGIEELKKLTRVSQTIENAKKFNSDVGASLVISVQEGLNRNGFECGSADGIAGNNTVLAIYNYQRSKGLTKDGKVTEKLASSLQEDE